MLRQNQFNYTNEKVVNMDSDNFDYDTSEIESESYQKFVKNGNDDIKQKLVKPTKSVDVIERPKTSRGALGKGHFDQSNAFQHQRKPSTALDRFSALEAKIKERQQTLKSTNYLSASSDYDLDISSDYDVKQSIGKENVKLRNEIKPKITIKSQGMNLNIADFSSSSSEDSSVKLRFLKKKSLPEEVSSQDSYENKKKSINQSQKRSTTKKVSFVSPDTSSVSLDHVIPQKSVSEDDISSLDDFAVSTNIHNVMSLDDLFVAEDVSSMKQAREESTPVKYSSDFEVSTEKFSNYSESENETSDSRSKGFMNIQGIEELQAFHAPQKDNDDVKESEVESIISEVKEVEEYSEDFHEDDTLKETDSISVDSVHEEIEEIITDSTITEEISHKSSTNSTITDSSYSSSTITKYTSEFSYEDTTPQPTKIKTPQSPQPKADMCTQTVNFEDAKTKESYSFAPSRLVKDEAIDILTTYNPATLAIQDLLKQQVNLTQEFVAQSRRLHDLTNSSIPCDYVYGAIDLSSLQRYRRLMNKPRYEEESS